MVAEGLAPLVAFREALYGCLGRRRDALFELADALLTGAPPPSLAHLSLAPLHRRGWGSVYAARRRGEVAEARLRDLLLRQPGPAGPPDYAVDVSVWPRRDAATSPERGFYYYPPAKHRQPVVEGWAYQWIARLTPDRDSWTAPVDVQRVRPWEKPNEVAAAQIPALAARLPAPDAAGGPPLFVFDAGYDAAHFSEALADAPIMLLIRLRSHRVFYADPVPDALPPTGRRRRAGAEFVCDDPTAWPASTAELRVEDAAYGHVSVRAWGGLHSVVRRPILQPRGRGRGGAAPAGLTGATAARGGAPAGPSGAGRSSGSRADAARPPCCGCGGRARAARPPPRSRTWSAAGERTRAGTTWNKHSDS
jgi:DDE superfamily endonuclease